MRKAIKQQEEKNVKSSAPSEPTSQPLPQYLLDREKGTNAKALSSAIKNKRSEKAAKFSVPLPKVRGISEEEMFKVVKTGKKTAKKGWKRMITKPTFGAILSLSFLPPTPLLLPIETTSCFKHRPQFYTDAEQ
jgi:ribosome biogenesis protein NSA2